MHCGLNFIFFPAVVVRFREKKNWLCKILGAKAREVLAPRISGGYFFFSLFHLFHVSLDGLSERGTTVFNRISAALK